MRRLELIIIAVIEACGAKRVILPPSIAVLNGTAHYKGWYTEVTENKLILPRTQYFQSLFFQALALADPYEPPQAEIPFNRPLVLYPTLGGPTKELPITLLFRRLERRSEAAKGPSKGSQSSRKANKTAKGAARRDSGCGR